MRRLLHHPVVLIPLATIGLTLILVGSVLTSWRGFPTPRLTATEKIMGEIEELRAELSAPPGLDPEAMRVMEHRLGLLEQLITEAAQGDFPNLKNRLSDEVAEVREDLESLRRGEGYLRKDRSTLLAYHADLDDSFQPFEVFLPKSYDGLQPRALIVLLHGYGHFYPLQCRAREIGEAIVVAPQGRGAMDYMFVGEGDVFRVIEEACRLFSVDENRIYLAGSSMGGTGSWHLATHFPDRFGGVAACCGNTDVQVWRDRWQWRTPENSPQAEIRDFLRDDTSSATWAANLRNVPIVALHGEEDQINNRAHADQMIAALKDQEHPNWRFILLPLVQHGFSVDFEKAFASFKRNPHPERVVYATSWLRYSGSDWLRIEGFQRRLRRATVDGEADPRTGTVKVVTGNVNRLAIAADDLPPMNEPVRLTLDGQALPFDSPTDPGVLSIYARGEDGRWSPASPGTPFTSCRTTSMSPPSSRPTVRRPMTRRREQTTTETVCGTTGIRVSG